ncbi:symmetrical bis(5'-nucleosyl)-tetraphosphatase [Spirochaeta dissipatitropha]
MPCYVIGDVHGNLDALHRLLEKFHYSSRSDELLFVGDLVNRGGQSIEVLNYVRSLGSSAVTVLGNHDLYALAYREGLLQPRQSDGFKAMLDHSSADAALDWLGKQPLLIYQRRRRLVLVHAGIPPQWNIKEASLRAGAAESILHGSNTRKRQSLLQRISRDRRINAPEQPFPYCPWQYLQEDAAAYTIQAFTHLRFTNSRGDVFPGSNSEEIIQTYLLGGGKNQEILPWFRMYSRRQPGLQAAVCFGHWARLGGLHEHPYYGLDTNCGGGHSLTALNIRTKQLWSVDV